MKVNAVQVVLLGNDSYLFSKDYLEEVIGHPIDTSHDFSQLESGCVIVYQGKSTPDQLESIERLVAHGGKFALLHAGDEVYHHDRSIYEHASFVYREYYREDIMSDPKVHTLPLGTKSNFKTNDTFPNPPPSQRKWKWSFMGQVTKSCRPAMIAGMKRVHSKNYIHYNTSFDGQNCL